MCVRGERAWGEQKMCLYSVRTGVRVLRRDERACRGRRAAGSVRGLRVDHVPPRLRGGTRGGGRGGGTREVFGPVFAFHEGVGRVAHHLDDACELVVLGHTGEEREAEVHLCTVGGTQVRGRCVWR